MQNGVLLDISNKINKVQTRILNASPNSQERDTNEINNTDTTLSVNDTFKDWDAVEIAVNTYAKQNGFVAIKSRKDIDAIDKTIVRRCVYSCWKAGTSNPKKVEDISLHRESVSTKTNCPWQVAFYYGKNTAVIRLTKLDNNHNHQCDPVTIDLAPKNCHLPKAVFDKIEHYITNGRLGAAQQYDLLTKEFPECHIKKKNLYNAIQKFRGVRVHDESDAAVMLSYLMKLRAEDPNYIVVPRLEGPTLQKLVIF
ncbi:18487_t:CDS:2 [Rhizophagus irregularis]|nr:18487_t:CDS:2 [Rhizophagus irregularis]